MFFKQKSDVSTHIYHRNSDSSLPAWNKVDVDNHDVQSLYAGSRITSRLKRSALFFIPSDLLVISVFFRRYFALELFPTKMSLFCVDKKCTLKHQISRRMKYFQHESKTPYLPRFCLSSYPGWKRDENYLVRTNVCSGLTVSKNIRSVYPKIQETKSSGLFR